MSATRKSTLTFALIAALAAIGPAALPAPAMAQYMGPGGYTVRGEMAAHPRLVAAIRELQATYNDLQAAPEDFGGNKGRAMTDLQRAIHSLRRALFYRLRMDDAALDQVVIE